MQKGLIGVIVPVYKTEEYIAECIESILAQTYTNFRLILVDDGSPDGAGAICEQYAAKDNRITVIHQENAGVTRARARGVEEASDCEWITFVDSDDTIIPNAFKILSSNTQKYNTDITFCYVNGYKKISTFTIRHKDYLSYLLSETIISPAPWGKLFNRKLFDDKTFDIPRSIVIAEDLIMNIRLALNTRKDIGFVHQAIYEYKEYENGTFHSHVRTPKNEQEIHENKIKSLPYDQKEQWVKFTIAPRLLRFRELWGYKYFVNGMKETTFHIVLCNDIKKYKIKLPLIDYIIFSVSNPIIRFFAINLKKAKQSLIKYVPHS